MGPCGCCNGHRRHPSLSGKVSRAIRSWGPVEASLLSMCPHSILFPNLTGPWPRYLHLASLNRCADLVGKHIPPDDLATPGGRYAAARSDLESSLAFLNLSTGRLKAAETHFRKAAEYLLLQQQDAKPDEAALYLHYGLATTYHKLRDTETAPEALQSVLAMAIDMFEEDDPRTVEIYARAKAVADLSGLNLRHHKGALLATTAGGGSKPQPEPWHQEIHPRRAALAEPSDLDRQSAPEMSPGRMNDDWDNSMRGSRDRQRRSIQQEHPPYEYDSVKGQSFIDACKRGDTDSVSLMLGQKDGGAEVLKAVDAEGRGGLFWATIHGHAQVMELIMPDDATTYAALLTDSAGCEAPTMAVNAGHTGSIRVLLERSALRPFEINCMFERAAGTGYLDIVELLLPLVCTPPPVPIALSLELLHDIAKSTLSQALWFAALSGRVNVVRRLLQCPDLDLDYDSKNGRSAIFPGCGGGSAETVDLLLKSGPFELNESDDNERTPLLVAMYGGHLAVVEILIGQEKIDLNLADSTGETPIFHAIRIGDLRIIRSLLDSDRLNLGVRNDDGCSPLLLAVRFCRNEPARLLFEAGADATQPDKDGIAPFFEAILFNNMYIATILLLSVPHLLKLKNARGETPLEYARRVTKLESEENPMWVIDLQRLENVDAEERQHLLSNRIVFRDVMSPRG